MFEKDNIKHHEQDQITYLGMQATTMNITEIKDNDKCNKLLTICLDKVLGANKCLSRLIVSQEFHC